MPVNLDYPVDGRENMFVFCCYIGVPYPWREMSMGVLAGDPGFLSSYFIHRGGAVPREAPAGPTRSIAYSCIATYSVDYEITVPVILPPCADAPRRRPSPPRFPKAVHCTAAEWNSLVRADPPSKCFTCDNMRCVRAAFFRNPTQDPPLQSMGEMKHIRVYCRGCTTCRMLYH